MAFRIEIRVEECMSSGKCVADYGTAFGFDADELAMLLPAASDLSDKDIERAARNCPSRAIMVFDANGEQVAT